MIKDIELVEQNQQHNILNTNSNFSEVILY
jgi:hypothetical protein